MKKIIIIIVSAFLAVGGTAAGAAIYTNQPEYIIRSAIMNSVEDLTEREEVEYLLDVLDEGSIEFSGSDEGALQGNLNPIKTSGKFYFNQDGVLLEDFSISGVEQINDIKAEAYVGKDKIYISNDSVLDGTYGLVVGENANAFKKSVFKPGSGSAFEMDEDTYQLALAAIHASENEELKKLGSELAKDYVKVIWKNICEFGEFEVEKGDMRFDGDKTSVRRVTLKIDGDAMVDILFAVYDYACDDEKLRDFMDELSYEYGRIEIDGKKTTIIDYYDEYFLEDKYDRVSESIESFEDIEDELEISVVTKRLSTTLLQLVIKSGNSEIEIDFGKNGVKKSDKISVDVDGVKTVFEVRENTKEKYEATLEDDDGSVLFGIKIDKKREKYTVNINEEVDIKGEVTVDGKETTLTIDKINDVDTDITVVVSTEDEMPETEDDIKNILSVDEWDIEEWIDELKRAESI